VNGVLAIETAVRPAMFRLYRILLLGIWLIVLPVSAQETLTPVITANNIARLGSVAHIDFEGTTLTTGWFVMNHSGTRFVSHSATEIYLWDVDASGLVSSPTIIETKPAVLTAAVFGPDETLYGILQGDESQIVMIEPKTIPLRILDKWIPLSLWADEEALWVEAFSDDLDAQEAVLRIPYDAQDAIAPLPYAPAEDLDAVVRIGRITPPYAVTSTEDGHVSVWDLASGERLYEVDSRSGEAVVFGAMNASASHLAWRDAASEALYWLDLKTGENQRLERLNGDYVQWFFLTPDADVILGIDKGFSQRVNAWIVGGKTLDLGPYIACKRPQPDMALLSRDGTTLAIGCDSGIDVWRIGKGS
jgi:hypothetical protein